MFICFHGCLDLLHFCMDLNVYMPLCMIIWLDSSGRRAHDSFYSVVITIIPDQIKNTKPKVFKVWSGQVRLG